VIVDCGRVFRGSPTEPVLIAADLVLLVAEPTLAAVEHLRTRLPFMERASSGRVAVLLVGDRPYGPREVEHALGVPVVGAMAVDPRGVAAVHAGGGARSLLVRSARDVLDVVQQLSSDLAGVGA
jgi:Flp pilus assembly CpaE family ATPase